MFYGSLEVTVVEGRNLTNEDKFGKNDPFIELYLDKDYKQKTSTIKNSNTPVWYETFHFDLQKGEDHLYIKVYDEDLIGKDSIGSAKIDLKKIHEAGGYLDEWVQLPAHLGLRSHGEIHLILRLA